MKEAFGGIFNIFFLVLFLVIVMGILGLVVSYTKAFKMKNAVISAIEEYEGSGCYPSSGESTNTACINRIKRDAQGLKYNPVNLYCNGLTPVDNLYCYEMTIISKDGEDGKAGKRYAIFTVVTQVDISFPIVERIMGFRTFQVSGDTMMIQLHG